MFIITLRFADNRSAAADLMADHNDWIAQGFADGIFHCVGSLMPDGGGAVIAQGESRGEIEQRVQADPFVAENVVTAEIIEIDVRRTSPEFARML